VVLSNRLSLPVDMPRKTPVDSMAIVLFPQQLQTHRFALGRGLDRGDERCLAGGAAAALAAGTAGVVSGLKVRLFKWVPS